jgi:phosphopantetheinyl transferase (holo-ACP synthase)
MATPESLQDIIATLLGTDGAAVHPPAALLAPEQHVQHNGATPSITCDVAIEMVASLPVVADYGSDVFYSTTFTPAEIAYCLLQDQPLVHFAARWCAKEALKKCDLTYLHADLRTLEVRLSASGTPYLCAVSDGHSTPLPFALSLSYTTQAAVAVVVKVPATPTISLG